MNPVVMTHSMGGNEMFDKPLHIYDMHEEWLMMFKSYLQIERLHR